MISEIDLHGMKHEEVRDVLDRFINTWWGTNKDICIITGNSDKLKKIVVDILDEYKLVYKTGDYSGQNMGYITTYLD